MNKTVISNSKKQPLHAFRNLLIIKNLILVLGKVIGPITRFFKSCVLFHKINMLQCFSPITHNYIINITSKL